MNDGRKLGIAIDGPAGAGKSTIAKALANKLLDKQFVYVNSGAMYRAFAYSVLKHGVDTENEDLVVAELPVTEITVRWENGKQHVFLNGKDVTDDLDSEEIGMAASTVSRYPSVRKYMTDLQKKVVQQENVIIDGRAAAWEVIPDATLKIYLTADVDERVDRRIAELGLITDEQEHIRMRDEMLKRDEQDASRDSFPLKMAPDAILIDSTQFTVEEVVNIILMHYERVTESNAA